MSIERTRISLGLVLSIASVGQSQGWASNATKIEAIDRYVAGKMRSARIPGLALGIVRGDRIEYLRGYGYADPSGRPVTPQTPFMIGSITKSFTALAVMQLVEAGKVDLDAPVQRYLPWFQVADRDVSARITVRHLLTMTSGLPQLFETQLWTDDDDGALERTVRFLATVRLKDSVGAFGYSNANYEVLGMIVQSVAGCTYEEYVIDSIFGPLAMRNAFVSQLEAQRHGMASGYRWWFGIPVPVTLPYHRAELPAGYIIASAEDMTHFLIAEMNGGQYGNVSVLSPNGMTLRHTKPTGGPYGVGWEFLNSNGHTLIGHDGGTANFQSSLFFDPEARVGVIVVANVINALDAFASPSGSSPVDGSTLRAMAQVVLALATNRPLPSEMPGHERLTLIFDLVIAALTAALFASLARTPRRHRRLVQRGIASWPEVLWHSGLLVVAGVAIPVAVLYLWFEVPAWRVFVVFQPDLAYWLDAVAIALFIAGSSELAFATRLILSGRRQFHFAEGT